MPFAPTDIGGCLLWLKADAISSLNDGDAVSTWNDSSGNGYNATQTGTNRPIYKTGIINSKPIVRFAAASSQWMNTSDFAADGAGLSFFFVAAHTTTDNDHAIITKWDHGTSTSWALQYNAGELKLYPTITSPDGGGSSSTTSAASLGTGFNVVSVIYDGSQGTATNRLKFYKAGTGVAATVNASTPATLPDVAATVKIGAFGGALTRYLSGDIAEIVVYNSALGTTDRNAVEHYLGVKYGFISSDTTPPTITITSPTSDATYATSSSSLHISGTASDDTGVSTVTWSCDTGGSGSATGTTSWSVSGITLTSGDNVITVTATDAASNAGTDTITVTYTPVVTTPGGDMTTKFSKRIAASLNGTDVNTRMRAVANTAYSTTASDIQAVLSRYVDDLYKGNV